MILTKNNRIFSIYQLGYIDGMLTKINDRTYLIPFSLNSPILFNVRGVFAERS